METKTIQAEQAVIGALLIDDACHSVVFDTLRSDDFDAAANRNIFNAAFSLFADGRPVDAVTILEEMRRRGTADERTNGYLVELMMLTPTAANVQTYIDIVRDDSRRRALTDLAEEITGAAYSHEPSDAIIANMSARLDAMHNASASTIIDSQTAVMRWSDWINQQEKNPDFALVRTGYGSLDRQLGGGFFKTGFYVIGGRPGMGKTTAALNIAERIAARGKRVLFLSLEMSLEQIISKRIAILTGLPYNALYTGRMLPDDYMMVHPALQKVLETKFDIVADGVSTTQALGMLLRTQKGIDIVVVDYMGILEPAEEDRQKPKYEQMTNISKALKAMAKRNNIPVIALSQLNRDSLKNPNKRPSLADLRDTGAIEQDADGVILVHRPGYFNTEAEQDDIELIVAKNRHSGTGTVTLQWHAESGRITETDYEQEGIT